MSNKRFKKVPAREDPVSPPQHSIHDYLDPAVVTLMDATCQEYGRNPAFGLFEEDGAFVLFAKWDNLKLHKTLTLRLGTYMTRHAGADAAKAIVNRWDIQGKVK